MANINSSVQRTERIVFSEEDKQKPIYKFLSKTMDGRAVLMDYEENGRLDKKSRNLMVRLIIADLTNKAFKDVMVGRGPDHLEKFIIKREEFQKKARSIAQLFRTENERMYFSPVTYANKKRSGSAGALYEHYQYTKGKLRKAQLLKTKKNETKI